MEVSIGSLIIPLKDKSIRGIRMVIMTEVDIHLLKFSPVRSMPDIQAFKHFSTTPEEKNHK